MAADPVEDHLKETPKRKRQRRKRKFKDYHYKPAIENNVQDKVENSMENPFENLNGLKMKADFVSGICNRTYAQLKSELALQVPTFESLYMDANSTKDPIEKTSNQKRKRCRRKHFIPQMDAKSTENPPKETPQRKRRCRRRRKANDEEHPLQNDVMSKVESIGENPFKSSMENTFENGLKMKTYFVSGICDQATNNHLKSELNLQVPTSDVPHVDANSTKSPVEKTSKQKRKRFRRKRRANFGEQPHEHDVQTNVESLMPQMDAKSTKNPKEETAQPKRSKGRRKRKANNDDHSLQTDVISKVECFRESPFKNLDGLKKDKDYVNGCCGPIDTNLKGELAQQHLLMAASSFPNPVKEISKLKRTKNIRKMKVNSANKSHENDVLNEVKSTISSLGKNLDCLKQESYFVGNFGQTNTLLKAEFASVSPIFEPIEMAANSFEKSVGLDRSLDNSIGKYVDETSKQRRKHRRKRKASYIEQPLEKCVFNEGQSVIGFLSLLENSNGSKNEKKIVAGSCGQIDTHWEEKSKHDERKRNIKSKASCKEHQFEIDVLNDIKSTMPGLVDNLDGLNKEKNLVTVNQIDSISEEELGLYLPCSEQLQMAVNSIKPVEKTSKCRKKKQRKNKSNCTENPLMSINNELNGVKSTIASPVEFLDGSKKEELFFAGDETYKLSKEELYPQMPCSAHRQIVNNIIEPVEETSKHKKRRRKKIDNYTKSPLTNDLVEVIKHTTTRSNENLNCLKTEKGLEESAPQMPCSEHLEIALNSTETPVEETSRHGEKKRRKKGASVEKLVTDNVLNGAKLASPFEKLDGLKEKLFLGSNCNRIDTLLEGELVERFPKTEHLQLEICSTEIPVEQSFRRRGTKKRKERKELPIEDDVINKVESLVTPLENLNVENNLISGRCGWIDTVLEGESALELPNSEHKQMPENLIRALAEETSKQKENRKRIKRNANYDECQLENLEGSEKEKYFVTGNGNLRDTYPQQEVGSESLLFEHLYMLSNVAGSTVKETSEQEGDGKRRQTSSKEYPLDSDLLNKVKSTIESPRVNLDGLKKEKVFETRNGGQIDTHLEGVVAKQLSIIEHLQMPTNLVENSIEDTSQLCKEWLQTPDEPDGIKGSSVAEDFQSSCTKDNLLQTSLPFSHGAPVVCSKRKLLILDVNGLLADIILPPPKDCNPHTRLLGRAVFKRPYYLDFLEFCFSKFDVAIWSSRSKRILDAVVLYLLGDLKHKLQFCWDASHCTQTGYKTLENAHKPLVCKELRNIWEKNDPNLPWKKGDYNESNTLLLDDSPYKALFNPKYTAIFPHSFQYKNMDDNSLGPDGDLRGYLEKLAASEDVQNYVKQHPFGQTPISETSSLWGFYSKVLHSRPWY